MTPQTVSLEIMMRLADVNIHTSSNEQWAYIEGTNDYYAVSTQGRIASFKRSGQPSTKILKPTETKIGYVRVSINVNGKPSNINVHRLVASTFLGKHDGMVYVNHIDGVKNNNRLENLEWCTASQNNLHAYAIGLSTRKGEKNNKAVLTKREVEFMRYMKGLYPEIKPIDMARFYGLSNTPINKLLNFQSWTE